MFSGSFTLYPPQFSLSGAVSICAHTASAHLYRYSFSALPVRPLP